MSLSLMWSAVLHAGRRSVGWEALFPELRPLILGRLSVPELARAARTCREFQSAYIGGVAEERARLIALGRQTYGEAMFNAIVRASQRALCGLDAFAGELSRTGPYGVTMNAAGELESERHARGSVEKPRCLVWKTDDDPKDLLFAHVEGSQRRIYRPTSNDFRTATVSRMYISVGKTLASGLVRLDVRIGKEAPAAAMGLLLAICTENPETLSPCFQRPVTAHLAILDSYRPPSAREVEEVIGPLGPLPELFTIYPLPQPTLTPSGRKAHAWPRGVLKSLAVDVS
jgi:hypothetical protein